MNVNLNQNKYLKLFKQISKVASENQQSVYLVGGYVRDLLLGRGSEVKDIDFVTEKSGVFLAEKSAKSLGITGKISVFKNYGTAMFCYQGLDLEFVGARRESYNHHSRNPLVEQGTLEDDQKRRDFTINALAISLNENNFGELIDPFNGFEDLQKKILRTPLEPEVTYDDDPLRMMRAIRFASVLDFEIEESSFFAIKKYAERIKIVSIERVMSEFNKILLSSRPSKGLKLLEETGLLAFILPELLNLKGVEEIQGQRHKDNFYHTLEVVDNIAQNTDKLWLRWVALLHDIGKFPTKKYDKNIGWTFHGHEFVGSKMIKKIFQRLKLPLGADLKYVEKLVKMHARPIALVDEGVSDSAFRRLLFDAGEDFEDLFILCKADITTKNYAKQTKFKKNFEKVVEKIKKVEEKDKIRNFQPPISGEEIMELFGIQPGREIGILKEKVKEAILEGVIENSYSEAKKFVIEQGGEMGLVVS